MRLDRECDGSTGACDFVVGIRIEGEYDAYRYQISWHGTVIQARGTFGSLLEAYRDALAWLGNPENM